MAKYIEDIIKKNMNLYGKDKGPREAENEIKIELEKEIEEMMKDGVFFDSANEMVRWLTE